jgi:hypothetical protein
MLESDRCNVNALSCGAVGVVAVDQHSVPPPRQLICSDSQNDLLTLLLTTRCTRIVLCRQARHILRFKCPV